MITYTAIVESASGIEFGRFDKLFSVQAARGFNTVGSITLLVPDTYAPSFWQRDLRVKLYRSAYGGPRYLIGNTVWFLRTFKWLHSQKKWQVTGKDTLGLLERSIVAYTGDTLYADKTIDNGNDGPADDLIKAYLRENIGSLALDTSRDLSLYITIDDDLSLAPSTEKTASGRDLLSTFNELCNDAAANGVKLYYDLIPQVDGTFRFRLFKDYLGTDRPKVIFSPNFKNLTEVELTFDYAAEVTDVYVGGDGQNADRLISEVKDEDRIALSPFGRIEKFLDDKDVDSVTVLQTDGETYLQQYVPRVQLDGKIIDTPNLMFGRDFFYGDQVRATIDNYDFTCVFDAFSVTYENGQETLDLRLHGDL